MSLIDAESLRSVVRMARCSGFDQLTGLPNLRQFLREVQRELARAYRSSGSLVVLVLEPDNETELPAIAHQLRRLVREEDVVARLGQTTLGVLLVATSPDTGYLVANRFQAELETVAPLVIGMRMVEPQPDRRYKSAEIIREAVAALTEARSSGGLMVSWHEAGRV